jgi:addiction module toxin, relE/stbE family
VSDLKISFGSQFKRDIKKQFLILATAEWAEVLYCLSKQHPLPEKYSDHPLTGNWIGFRECHIQPDMLLIYDNSGDKLILVRLGTHSELF